MKTEADLWPYVGLRPFTERERRYFFGREREQRVIFSSLSASPLTVLYGPSGTGKSSVLQAGLLPMVRVRSRRTGIVYFNRWHNASFLEDLKQRCVAEAKHVARNKNFPVDAALPLHELIVELQRHLSRPLLIVLDQFEEYLLDYPETNGGRPFESELARAVTLAGGSASFLIALREDSLSRLDRFRTRIPNLLGNTLRLEALNKRGAEEAIRKPLEVYRKRHGETSGPVEIEDALVTKVLDQVSLVHAAQLGDAAGEGVPTAYTRGDKIEAAILQLVMRRLWDEERNDASRILRVDTLDRLEGAARIVETHFTRAMDNFTSAERETCAAIFRFLVRPSGEKVAYTPSDLAASAERSPEEVSAVLKKLVASSILRKTDAPERYELLHDILGPAIIGWRNRHVQGQQVAREAAQREAQLAAERKSRTVRIAITLTVVFMALTGYSVRQTFEARDAAERTRRDLARLVAARFEQAALKGVAASDKNLLFLLRARQILAANELPLESIDKRLTDAISSWPFPPLSIFAFTNSTRPSGDFLTIDRRAASLLDLERREGTFSTDVAEAIKDKRTLNWWDVTKREKTDSRSIEQLKVRINRAEGIEGSSGGVVDFGVTSRDGRRIVVSTLNWTAIWKPGGDEETVIWRNGQKPLSVLALSDVDDRMLVYQDALEVWMDAERSEASALPENFHARRVLFRAKTSQLIAMDHEGLALRDIKSPSTAPRQFRGKRGEIRQFALSPNGKYLAFAESEGAVRLADLDASEKTEPHILAPTVQDCGALAFDRDSKQLAGFGGDGKVFVWDVRSEKCDSPITVDPAISAIFSYDLRWIATFSSAGVTVRALTPPQNKVAEAEKRAKGQLEFEDVAKVYSELTEYFQLGLKSARDGQKAEAAKYFRNALAMFDKVDPGLSFDAESEANRFTALGFLARAQAHASEGKFEEAQKDYVEALNLKQPADSNLVEDLRKSAFQALLRRANGAATDGDLVKALENVRKACEIDAQACAPAEKRVKQMVAQSRVNDGRRKLDSGEQRAALDLFDQALKLDPALGTSLNPQQEIEKAQARGLIRQAMDSLKADRVVDAIRKFAQAQKLAGAKGEQEFAQSDALARAGYDASTSTLEIEFRSGATYRYAAMPPEIYKALLRAESKGRYYSDQIRGKYASERLDHKSVTALALDEQLTIGSLVKQLLKAANQAATLAPTNAALRQTRGVARALAGDLTGAADDLTAFASDPSRADTAFGRQNKAWAEQLRSGTNPFTSEALEQLPIP